MQTTKGREVTRRRRALSEDDAWAVIEATDHAIIATSDEAGVPYAVPITPVAVNREVIYFHQTALRESRRRDNLRMNPEVSLCFVAKGQTVPEQYTVHYRSAVVSGRARVVTDLQEKTEALLAIGHRHAPENALERLKEYVEGSLEAVEVWRIDVDSITGKSNS